MPLDVAAAKQSCAAAGRPEAEPMIVLATGTGGFVGSATALVLKQRGHGASSQGPAEHMRRSRALSSAWKQVASARIDAEPDNDRHRDLERSMH